MRTLLLLIGSLCCLPLSTLAQNVPIKGLKPSQLAVVVNDDEANSVEIAEYYVKARAIPAHNVVHVRIPNRPRRLTPEQFKELKEQIDSKLGSGIEAVLMVWTAPYAVDCNSITSAYSLGFDAAQCAKPCGPGKDSPYFNSAGGLPSSYKLRLSMLLPTESVEGAKALIDRGVQSGFQVPPASAYFLITSDAPRSSRARFFPQSTALPLYKLAIKTLRQDTLENVSDIMVYETGLPHVAKLDTLRFLPGALADHLTSVGGDLLGEGQMSSLRWLEAGATASYGTVSEPCNYWQKFPNSTVLLRHYLGGATAIEAYCKSGGWPAQGLFIGEPLAAPYARAPRR